MHFTNIEDKRNKSELSAKVYEKNRNLYQKYL